MSRADLNNRFGYHPASTDAIKNAHTAIRTSFLQMALHMDLEVPESREKSLALTNLEQAMFWSNAAIARLTPDGERR